MGRIEAAARLAAEKPPLLERQDAGQFVAEMLAAPQHAGVTRVLYHSVMWQYLPPQTRAAITAAMEQAGARATAERPLAWVALETNRETFRHELSIRYWPGGERSRDIVRSSSARGVGRMAGRRRKVHRPDRNAANCNACRSARRGRDPAFDARKARKTAG